MLSEIDPSASLTVVVLLTNRNTQTTKPMHKEAERTGA
jgi:hypothetical protein